MPLHIILPEMSAYRRNFDESIFFILKVMYFLIKDN